MLCIIFCACSVRWVALSDDELYQSHLCRLSTFQCPNCSGIDAFAWRMMEYTCYLLFECDLAFKSIQHYFINNFFLYLSFNINQSILASINTSINQYINQYINTHLNGYFTYQIQETCLSKRKKVTEFRGARPTTPGSHINSVLSCTYHERWTIAIKSMNNSLLQIY